MRRVLSWIGEEEMKYNITFQNYDKTIEADSEEEAVEKWWDNLARVARGIQEMIRDNESVCSECGRTCNDSTETKWDKHAEPYCKNCYGRRLLIEFEDMRDMAELKALSNYSLENPLTDSQYQKMMQLKKKVLKQ